MTDIMHRTNVVLSAVAGEWLTTTDIHAHLTEHGFPWSSTVTRDTLHFLASTGTIERRKRGAALVWRTPEPEQVPIEVSAVEIVDGREVPLGEPRMTTTSRDALDLLHGETTEAALVDTIKQLANTLGVPLALLAPPSPQRASALSEALMTLAEADAADIAHLHEATLKQAVQRAAYDMGKALLDVLTGWVEGAAENHVAMDHRDDNDGCLSFTETDIRRMVNDAARVMGAPDPYTPAVQ